ncbi:uncharacterized protein LOC133723719 [Rosa rugosa]|uniref:uncharacterized protein LOC133723719 n=1 Tax=Rosa rugosa TaxID=74645 RepID=UPI002B4174C5|nr:uncharacterized protein LOC133723719 [Rosa rugosa]
MRQGNKFHLAPTLSQFPRDNSLSNPRHHDTRRTPVLLFLILHLRPAPDCSLLQPPPPLSSFSAFASAILLLLFLWHTCSLIYLLKFTRSAKDAVHAGAPPCPSFFSFLLPPRRELEREREALKASIIFSRGLYRAYSADASKRLRSCIHWTLIL